MPFLAYQFFGIAVFSFTSINRVAVILVVCSNFTALLSLQIVGAFQNNFLRLLYKSPRQKWSLVRGGRSLCFFFTGRK
jgi:hypothetical protein